MSIGSFFGNIVSSLSPAFNVVGTAAGGFFAAFKSYIIIAVVVLVVTVIGGTVWYVRHLQTENNILTVNNTQLTDALNTEKNSFATLQKESAALTKSYQDLLTKENQIQKQNDLLEQKIRSFDFKNNAIKNHDLTEKEINDETDEMLQNIETLTDPNNLTPSITPPVKVSPPKKGKK